ncbi:hypothetical protein HPP92_006970 [Vanilla planifolia]|uniref:Uncharacterized protein n=1 Tax=Vanilla planifolia TaxID=51239 RepID=A0A835RFR9_VANPL|nr:hypothetical protein HPP92_006970 [Vanilla planifolia]
MICALPCNIQGVHKTFSRNHLQEVVRCYNPFFIALLEMWVDTFLHCYVDHLLGPMWTFYVEPLEGKLRKYWTCCDGNLFKLELFLGLGWLRWQNFLFWGMGLGSFVQFTLIKTTPRGSIFENLLRRSLDLIAL